MNITHDDLIDWAFSKVDGPKSIGNWYVRDDSSLLFFLESDESLVVYDVNEMPLFKIHTTTALQNFLHSVDFNFKNDEEHDTNTEDLPGGSPVNA